jgi:hypothetical protein
MEVFVQMNRNEDSEGQSYELLTAREKFRPFAIVGHYECREPWVLQTTVSEPAVQGLGNTTQHCAEFVSRAVTNTFVFQ